jgi:FRG domain
MFKFVGEAELPAHVTREGRVKIRLAHSPVFGTCWAPHSFTELGALIQWPFLGAGNASGWRGQADAAWPLHSGAYRRLSQQPELWLGRKHRWLDLTSDPEAAVRSYEAQLIDHARLDGHGHLDGRRLSDLEVLARLQHHGAATRLVDFTSNALIALWFACRDTACAGKWGTVFGASLHDADWIQTDSSMRQTMDALLNDAGNELRAWRPSALSPRIGAQSAFLLWSQTQRDCQWSSLRSEPAVELTTSQLDARFTVIAVSPRLKAQMSFMWKPILGMSVETMFPDFDGYAGASGPSAPFDWDPLARTYLPAPAEGVPAGRATATPSLAPLPS